VAANSRKAANSFLPLYGGDYLRDTMGNSPAHDGIYFRLLIHYWHSQAPLPDDVEKVRRIARVSGEKEERFCDDILRDFFRHCPGIGWRNKRMDAEIDKAKRLKRKRKKAGKAGATSRWRSDGKTDGKRITKRSPATATATKGEVNPTSPLNPLRGDEPVALELIGKPDEKPTAPSEAAYRKAIATRYGADPGPLNAKQRGQLSKMLDRIPRDEAPAIVAHYVAMDGPRGNLYASASHPIDLLLRDCEAIRLAWQTKDRKPPPVVNGANGSWYKVARNDRAEAFKARGLALGVEQPKAGAPSGDWSYFFARVWIRSEGDVAWYDDKDGTMERIVNELREKARAST
jgi:uncharacterized protein YdaU (DUF1376 family)